MQKLRSGKLQYLPVHTAKKMKYLDFFETKLMPHKNLEITKSQMYCLSPKSYGYFLLVHFRRERGAGKKPPTPKH